MKSKIWLDRSSCDSLYVQIYKHFRNEISAGNLSANERLPSIMQLKCELNVSRNTVESAYQQLLSEGFIYSIGGSGYYAENLEECEIKCLNSENRNINLPPFESIHISGQNVPFDFKPGSIDRDSFPSKKWCKLEMELMNSNPKILACSDPRGERPLREQIALYVKQSRGVDCHPDQIVVSAVTQNLMAILCYLMDPNLTRSIAFEEPGFSAARRIFEWQGYKIHPIPLTENGIDIDCLRSIYPSPRLVYTTPSNQHPLGMLMPAANRIQLLSWAHESEGYIIEDDYDSEFRYNMNPIPSLQSMDSQNRVIYLGTFSKTLFLSMHVGYMILPEALMGRFIAEGRLINQSASKIHQLTIARFMELGYFDQHLRRMRKIYSKKQSYLTSCIESCFSNRIRIHGRYSGLNVALEVNSAMNESELIEKALSAGVKVYPLSFYYYNPPGSGGKTVFLGYGHMSMDQISEAINRLQKAWS